MIWVKSPQPHSDVVTLTRQKTGEARTIPVGQIEIVPVGRYKVAVKMQNYDYTQDVLVQSTERTDVVVPGFGNLKVMDAAPGATVEVLKRGSQKVVAKFPATQVKVLPRGRYDVNIKTGSFNVSKKNVWIVTNTTRILQIIIKRTPPQEAGMDPHQEIKVKDTTVPVS